MSCRRHNRVLLVEFNKTRRNKEVVRDLMDKTFAVRRRTILDMSPDLSSLFKDYLFRMVNRYIYICTCTSVTINAMCTLQLVKELERIVGREGAAEESKVAWKEMAPKTLEQAHLEKQNHM